MPQGSAERERGRENPEYMRAIWVGYQSVVEGLAPNYDLFLSIPAGQAYANGRLLALEMRHAGRETPAMTLEGFHEYFSPRSNILRGLCKRAYDMDMTVAFTLVWAEQEWRAPHLVRADMNEALKAARLGSLAADDNMTTTY